MLWNFEVGSAAEMVELRKSTVLMHTCSSAICLLRASMSLSVAPFSGTAGAWATSVMLHSGCDLPLCSRRCLLRPAPLVRFLLPKKLCREV